MIKNLATICLALAFVFTGTGGALAQFFPPVANAGPDLTVASGATVRLDGRGSTPGTGATIDFYYWRSNSNSNNPVCAVPPPLIEPNSARPSFTAPILEAGDADVIYCFSLLIEDTEEDTSDWDEVRVTVTAPPFPALEAEAGPDRNVVSGTQVTLEGSGTATGSGRVVTYLWTRSGGTGDSSVAPSNPALLQTTFTAETLNPGDASVTHEFTLTVMDDQASTEDATDTVTFTVTAPPFDDLIAVPGTGRLVDSGEVVPLDGTGSTLTGGGRVVTYLWIRSGGTGDSSVTPSNPALLQTTFTAETLNPGDASVTHEFTLRVTDDQNSAGAGATVTFTVTAPAFPPLVAEAGTSRSVDSGAVVPLDGTGSTSPGGSRVVVYAWTRTGGTGDPTVMLSDPAVLQPTFVADTLNPGDADVTHEFTLIVTDNKNPDGESDGEADMVTITVEAPELPPLEVNAGPDKPVASEGVVNLEGSGTASDSNRAVIYAWTRTGGTGNPAVMLSDPAVLEPTFVADTLNPGDADVTHEFTLVVTDDKGSDEALGVADMVTITVTSGFADPVANAGPDQTGIISETVVTLDGSGSTVDRRSTVKTWFWERTDGTGAETVALSDPNAERPTFTADTLAQGAPDVTQVFTLTVTDSKNQTDTDEVTITITSMTQDTTPPMGTFKVPVSHDGKTPFTITIVFDEEARFIGRHLEPELVNDPETGQTDGNIPELSNHRKDPNDRRRYTFTVTPKGSGVIRISLGSGYTDWFGNQGGRISSPVIPHVPPLPPLEVNAGPDKPVASEGVVNLEGSGTASDSSRVVIYAWTRIGGTGDPAVMLSDRTVLQPTFVADTLNPGDADVTHTFALVVTDDKGSDRVDDTVTITVQAPPLPPLEADPGPDQTFRSKETVTLRGSGTASDSSRVVVYAWTRTGGTGDPAVMLSDRAVLQPTFVADTLNPGDADVTHKFALVVTDDKGSDRVTDTVTITVKAPKFPFLDAEAGDPQMFDSKETVTLRGSGTASDSSRVVTYAWTRTGGTGDPAVMLSNPAVLQPTFVADTLTPGADSVTHIFKLTVTDDKMSLPATDTVTITVLAPPDTVGPIGMFESPPVSHDGKTPFTITIVFDEEARFIGRHLEPGLVNDPETGQPDGNIPSLSNHRKDPNDRRRYTFTVTPRGSGVIRISLRSGYTDWLGNQGGGLEVEIPYVSPNEPPVADAGSDQPVPSGGRVILDGSGSLDDDGTIEHYSWRLISGGSSSHDYTNGGSGYSTSRSDIPVETVPRGAADVTLVFELTVTDDDGATSTDTVTITVESPNAAPIANAGTNQIVESGARVTLDGRGSHDIDGDIVSYLWSRMGGSENSGATLSNANATQPSFTADTVATGAQNVTHIFSLVVMDDEGESSTANQVTITVEPQNLAPIADGGPYLRKVASGTMVTLDGSGSFDKDGTIESYRWRRNGGSGNRAVALSGANTAQLTFTADTLESGASNVWHYFLLVVTDNDGAQTISDQVYVEVTSQNIAPIADAGPNQVVASGATVQLDGSRSWDRDGTIASYDWAHSGRSGGSEGILKNGRTAQASFTAPTLDSGAADIYYSIRLRVTDSGGKSTIDTVTVTIKAPNRPIPVRPIADAGQNQVVASGATVQLDGSRSRDGDGTIASYSWRRTGGTLGRNVALIGADTERPNFTADTLEPGGSDVRHTFTLTVTNSEGVASITDSVGVKVTAPNAHPFADAGPDQVVASGATVQLDGSRSRDPDGTIVSYIWGVGSVAGEAVRSWHAKRVSFTAVTLEPGAADVTYAFGLTVFDDGNKMSRDSVRVTVTAPNIAPVAVAGDDQEVASGETVYLDGNGSSDQDGTIEKYLWERVDGTSSRKNVFEPLDEFPTNSVRGEEPRVSFTADTLSSGAADITHVFNLWVADNDGAWSVADQVTVTITAETTALASYADPGTDRLSAGGDVDILVSPSELTVQEGGPGSYRVKLSESPGQNVIVTAASSNEDVVLENPHLSFNADNWNEWQQVTLRAVADSDNANDVAQIRHSIDANAVTVGQPGVVSITVRDEDIILRPIGEYLETRATTLLRNQPKLIHFLKLNGTTPDGNNTLSLNATDDNLNLDGEFVRDGMWGAITGSYASNSSGELNYALGSFGIHWKSSEHLLAGAMLQFDLADGDLGGRAGSIDGKGWLAGPYFAARHVTQPLFFEGRMLYGQSNQDFKFNDDVFGERNGSFSTTRWLAQLRMEGEIALSTPWSDGSRLIPYADARWTEDRAAAFTDSIGIRVPGQKVSIGEFELGSNIEVPVSMAHGSMTFTGGLGVVFSNTDGDYVRSESRSRGRGEVGFSYSLDDNVQIDFEGYFDGIGTSQYESYGLSLSAVMKF